MSFAPQRRALFRHPKLQKWSEPLVFLTFWLRNVLRATTTCTFSTSQLPKVVRTWCVLYTDFKMCFAPQRRALFRHRNFQKWSDHGVFCAFSLRNVLRATTACNFSSLIWPAGSAPAALASLLFDPPGPQIIGKTQCFATFLPFRASASSFFWLFPLLIFLFSLPLPCSAFHLSILSEVWLLNFLRTVHLSGGLPLKPPLKPPVKPPLKGFHPSNGRGTFHDPLSLPLSPPFKPPFDEGGVPALSTKELERFHGLLIWYTSFCYGWTMNMLIRFLSGFAHATFRMISVDGWLLQTLSQTGRQTNCSTTCADP